MRIRRCASRLLGSAASSALPRFELPPPSPPAAQEPHAGFVAASGTSPSSLDPCELSLSPWDLMDQLHPSDPQEEKIFFETYLVAVAWRASWLFQPSMPAPGSIKEEEQQEEDMAAGVIFELQVCKKNTVRKKARKMKPNMSKEKIQAQESDSDATAGGETPLLTCKKNVNGGKSWSCWRPVSQPNSFYSYHSDQKPKRKRATDVEEGFYYYTGFGPSRSKRHRISNSSDGVPAEPQPAEEEMHIDSSARQAQADGADHQAAPPVHMDEPMSDDGTAGIAGCDEESNDDDVIKSHEIKSKSPLKKWRKPVKARSLKSLMYCDS
ncbi:hypothetical protein ACQ4PT_002376 [Festuca glaucescens]